jgi:hypothetical protein
VSNKRAQTQSTETSGIEAPKVVASIKPFEPKHTAYVQQVDCSSLFFSLYKLSTVFDSLRRSRAFHAGKRETKTFFF